MIVPLFVTLCLAAPFAEWVVEPAERVPSVGSADVMAGDAVQQAVAPLPPLPYRNLEFGTRDTAGRLWVATPQAVLLHEPDASRWRVFHSRRWLPEGEIESLVPDPAGGVVVSTRGVSHRLHEHRWTLAEKVAEVERQLRAHHVRQGLVGEIELSEPGNVAAGYSQPSNDNDGLWTCLYVAAQSFRYAVTQETEARDHARESLNALLHLEQVTGLPGFVARSVVPGTEPNPTERYGGVWYRSADGAYWWKGDTSSDEIDGHYFAYAIYYDLVADRAEREAIAGVVRQITDHILQHNYRYVGPDGKVTTWGVWDPASLNHDLEWIEERGLNSLEILSHLKVAEHVTGDAKYAAVARELIETHAYATNTIGQKLLWPANDINHSDDELAFVAYYPLLQYERDPELRRKYLASIERSWQIERPEQSPLFAFIYAAALQGPTEANAEHTTVAPEQYDRDACLAWFREVPTDTVYWSVRNSDRADVRLAIPDIDGRPQSAEVLPISERRVMKWNGNPYTLDGGNDGRVRDDGTFILLPYWLGRYHRLID